MTKRAQKPTPQSPQSYLRKILNSGDRSEVRALFAFNSADSDALVLWKFQAWARWFFPQYFKADDALFHAEIDASNLKVYRGSWRDFLDIIFRGGAKTTRTKLFTAFALSNDLDHRRKYIKVLTKDIANSKQFVTDIYNMLITERVNFYYPEIFERTTEKREETMASFTTSTGIKVRAGTVGTDQRGQIQEDARPDFLIFDDIETRNTLRSAVETQAIWDNVQEAINGLSKDGGAIYLANYLSERGNIHKLVERIEHQLIVPIIRDGKPTWSAYSVTEIETLRRNADDFAGEYLCEPSAGLDIFFDRTSLDRQAKREVLKIIADFKIFHLYDPSHRYGSGHDVGGGVGLDSSTSVFIDFSTLPNRVVATYKSNTIKPDTFGDEIEREANLFGQPIVAPENNKFDMAIGRLKQIYQNIYFTKPKDAKASEKQSMSSITYGWNTNGMTKPKMLFELKKAVEDGHLELSDPDLIAELRSYTRDDLMDRDDDVRLTTRHFDLLMAAAIAWQMRNYATVATAAVPYEQQPYESTGL